MPPVVITPPGHRPPPPALPRRRGSPLPPSLHRRRLLHTLLVFVATLLIADAVVGEKGFLQTARARREALGELEKLGSLREENARLREEKRRLSEDPAMIEAEARQQLGLAKPGEVMFILKDSRPPDSPR